VKQLNSIHYFVDSRQRPLDQGQSATISFSYEDSIICTTQYLPVTGDCNGVDLGRWTFRAEADAFSGSFVA
jgi:hypothetical protein